MTALRHGPLRDADFLRVWTARVERIDVADGRARGVDVEGLGQLEADAVLSTASVVMATFGRLVAPEATGGRLRRKVERTPLSQRVISVQLGLANEIEVEGHINAVLPMLPEQRRVFA